jgi:6-phosphogluconolactonase
MTALSEATREILPDSEALAQRAADWLLEAARATTDVFAVALAGGSTPRLMYELLGTPPRREGFPWSRTHWFWGDERFVPPDDPASNYRMVRDALLARAPIPEANIHPVPTVGTTPQSAAEAYERTLQRFYGGAVLLRQRPLFDVVLLGVGENGHTASLFPGAPILEERRRWVGWVTGTTGEPRVSLTYPALENSRHTTFLVAGPGKRPVLEQIFGGDRELPASRLSPVGSVRFFLDRAAAPQSA